MFSLSGLIPTLKSLQRDDKLKKHKWKNGRRDQPSKASVNYVEIKYMDWVGHVSVIL